jgi:uncharacterized protein
VTNVADERARTSTVLSWSDLGATVEGIAGRVRVGGVPDVLVGVLRGGIIPAVLLAHAFGVRSVRAVEVVHTATDDVDASKIPFPVVSNGASLGDLAGRDVLVVDDIAGTGDTIVHTVDVVHATGASRVRTAVCVVNAANWQRAQRPDETLTYVGATVQGWVIFPWEKR